ncbi:MAG: hypothetical protein ACLFTR_05005 [Candidatus Woesearchaeota archaeon]
MTGYDIKIDKAMPRNAVMKAEDASQRLRRVFRDSLDVGDERLLILGDYGMGRKTTAPALAYSYYLASKDLGLESSIVMQPPKSRSEEISPNVLRSLKALPKKSAIMQCVSNRLGTLNGLGKSFRKYCGSRDHRFTSASSLGNVRGRDFNTLVEAHGYNYKAMRKKQQRIKKVLDSGSEVQLQSPGGTDLIFSIKKSDAVYNHGIYDRFGKGGNLPAGEIYMPIDRRSAYGKLVIDGSSRQKDETVLCKKPISMYFNNGVVQKIAGGKEAKGLEDTYRWAESRAKHPWGIRMAAELGIGLNDRSKVVGATILDEKAKGTAHIATGSNHWFGGDIKAIVHLDQVFRNPQIRIDGRKLRI